MQPPGSCAPRIANFSIDVNDAHNQSFALVQIPAQLGPSKDPITFRIPSGLIPNDTAQLTVTAKTSADEVYVSVTSKFDRTSWPHALWTACTSEAWVTMHMARMLMHACACMYTRSIYETNQILIQFVNHNIQAYLPMPS